jgi:hypothetical protein
VLGIVVVVSPWAVRNYWVLGKPIVTTTHGGYTLLLGNNEVFFNEVARQPWGTTWETAPRVNQALWLVSEQRVMRAEGAVKEIAADAWMSRRAWEYIGRDPFGFAAACVVRQSWFWNIVPMGDARTGWPRWMIWGVGSFYAVLWIASLCGLFDVIVRRAVLWVPGLLVILAFSSAHLLYWSNARMRAPLVPILAVLAVRGAVAIVSHLWPSAPLARRR